MSLGIGEGFCDGKDRHDDDDDDGEIEIRWDDDKLCSDRLGCNFEFHSIMGIMLL